MSERLQELERLVGRLRASFTDPTTRAPSIGEMESFLGAVGKVVGGQQRFEEVSGLLRQRPLVLSPSVADSMASLLKTVRESIASDQAKKRAFEFEPNHIPLKERWGNFFFAAALLGYGALGLKIDDIYIPGKRGNGVHLHGAPAWVMFGAMACAAVVLTLTIVDHYDRRDNEHYYREAAKWAKAVGWGLFVAAFVIDLVVKFKR